jgi:hypothetical protein
MKRRIYVKGDTEVQRLKNYGENQRRHYKFG